MSEYEDNIRESLIDCIGSANIHGKAAAEAADLILSDLSGLAVHGRDDTGHEAARALIAKHGEDRYPTVWQNLAKLMEEVGELAGAILAGSSYKRLAKEYGDVAHTLHLLGDKLDVDLPTAMRDVLTGETRTVADGSLKAGPR